MAALVAAVVLVAGALAVAGAAFAPTLEGSGPSGELLGRATLARAVFRVDGSAADLREQRWTLDGRDVTSEVRTDGTQLVYRPARLADGEHEVAVEAAAERARPQRVSQLLLPRRHDAAADPDRRRGVRRARGSRCRLAGSAPGAKAFTVDGRAAALDGNRFVVRRTPPVPTEIVLGAVDEAGNRAVEAREDRARPAPPAGAVRAVHVTPTRGRTRPARGVMQLIDEGRINAVELDLKDESGVVGWDAPDPWRSGSARSGRSTTSQGREGAARARASA